MVPLFNVEEEIPIIQKFQMGSVGRISSDEALEVILGGIRLTCDIHFVLLLE